MNINYDDDFIFYNDSYDKDDELVDVTKVKDETSEKISKKVKKAKKNKSTPRFSKNVKHGKKSNKTVIVACCVAGVLLVGAAVAGVVIMNKPEEDKPLVEQPNKIFTYPEGTVVSGVSLAGKTYDESLELLNAKKDHFITPVTIKVSANGKDFELTQKDFEYEFNTEEILTELKKNEEYSIVADNTVSYEVVATCTKESVKAKTEQIKKEADKKPVNARVSEFKPYGGKDRFKYEEAKVGYVIDGNDLEQQLAMAVTGTSPAVEITAKVDETKAAITMDMVKKNIVSLATYETMPATTANAVANMKTALNYCNGSVIEPGKTWSFSGAAGDSNLESNGYKAAGVIVNGEMTQGIGGGICQASSTVYNAGIRANLEIVERHCHTFASDYVPTGLDSTIAYPVLDLKMKNTTEYQVFLECKMEDNNKLTVTFWGYKDPSYDEIKVANEISDVEDGEFSARAWRVYYKGGKEIKREELGSSQYESKGGLGGGSADGVTGLIPTTTSSTKPTRPVPDNGNTGVVRPPSYEVPDPVEPTEAPQPTEAPTEVVPTEPESEPTQEPTEPEVEPTEPVVEPTEAEAENADIQNEE